MIDLMSERGCGLLGFVWDGGLEMGWVGGNWDEAESGKSQDIIYWGRRLWIWV
jgi:hypothetical protein